MAPCKVQIERQELLGTARRPDGAEQMVSWVLSEEEGRMEGSGHKIGPQALPWEEGQAFQQPVAGLSWSQKNCVCRKCGRAH